MTSSIASSSRRPITCGLFGLALLLGTPVCSRQLDASPQPVESPQPPKPPSGPTSADDEGPITAAEQRAAIDALAAALNKDYVFPDKAAAIDKALHGQLQRGDFARITSGPAF